MPGTRAIAGGVLVAAAAVLAAARAEAAGGFIWVKSEPQDARICLDGADTPWRTPRLVCDVAPGRHVVLLKLDGFAEGRAEVTVAAGKIVTVDLALAKQSEQCALTVVTRPAGAVIMVDAVEKGVSPVTVKPVAPGPHEIVAVLDGYELATKEVVVEAGRSQTVELELAREGGAARPKESGTAPAGEGRGPEPATSTEPAKPADPAKPAEKDGSDAGAKTIEVDCPYCRGAGLLKTMGCCRCGKTGNIPFAECPLCGGRKELDAACANCQGRGRLVAGGREQKCTACGGRGYYPCVGCRGKGKIQRPNPLASPVPTAPCMQCDGSGFEQQVKCRTCTGLGKIDVTRPAGIGFISVSRPDCPVCGGDGKGPPWCVQCRGRGSFPSGNAATPCVACCGTGFTYVPCSSCGGRGFVQAK